MSEHRYTAEALRGDYLRSGAGFLLTGGLAAVAGGQLVATSILGAAALVFVAFGLRTWGRQRTTVALADDGISTSGRRCVKLAWRDLDAFKLRYYATRRDRTGGWMQLTLGAGRRRLTLESSLDGFLEVTRRAAAAAHANALTLDSATRNNLLALGIRPPAGAA